MPVTHVPAQPAVTKIVEVSPATPEKYVLELTLHQALCLAALSGANVSLDDDGGLWKAMCNHPLYRAYRVERDLAYGEDRSPCFKDVTGDVAPPGFIRVRRTAEHACWTVGRVYTVDTSRDFSGTGSFPGVVVDDAGDERIYFPKEFEPI